MNNSKGEKSEEYPDERTKQQKRMKRGKNNQVKE